MIVTNNNKLEFLWKHVVTRTDAYAVQGKSGRYRKVAKELTTAALQRHLDHIITIGLYNTGDDGRVKSVIWDIDNHEGKEIVPADIVEAKARKIIVTLKSFAIPYTFAESSPGCYHVYVFFAPSALTAEAYDFGRWVARNAGVPDVECFPKQRVVPEGDFGNLVRAPASLHQKKGTEYSFIDDKFNHINEFEVSTIDIGGFEAVEARPSHTPAVTPEPYTEGEPVAPRASLGGIPPCLIKLLEDGAQLTGGGGHYARISLVCAYSDAGLQFPALCKLFSGQSDYDQIETAKQVKSVLKKSGGYNYTCRTLRSKCEKFVLPLCKTCPRGRIFKD